METTTQEPIELVKKFMTQHVEELNKTRKAKAANAQKTNAANKLREGILKSALSKEMQEAFDSLQKLGLDEAKHNKKKIEIKPLAELSAEALKGKTPVEGGGNHHSTQTLKPTVVWAYNGVSANPDYFATNPGALISSEFGCNSYGWGASDEIDLTLLWGFVFYPQNPDTQFDYTIFTNTIKGYYSVYGGDAGYANVNIQIAASISQELNDGSFLQLPGISPSAQVFSQNSNGGEFSQPVGFDNTFSVSCNNMVPGTNAVVIMVTETFQADTHSGFFGDVTADMGFNAGGNYISAPTVQVKAA